MDGNIAIHVEHVSKKFRVYFDKGLSLKERILFEQRSRYDERKVLKDISFDVKKGEAIGLIGENGCGKSTMLKLLSRIMYPDSGSIEVNGRVSALIELGAGFHPDMSGRENIYTNAAIFGLSKAEIDRRLQTIIDFSELGDYIDNPVRTYSSGMYMRLAFSVAINVDADVLLIDEILAVGDMAFQSKCFNKLREIKRKGTTIVIVSHSLGQIEQICDNSYWIEGGLIREKGRPMDVHQKYARFMMERTGTMSDHDSSSNIDQNTVENDSDVEVDTEEGMKDAGNQETVENTQPEKQENRWGNRAIEFTHVCLIDDSGNETLRLENGKPFKIQMDYRVNQPLEELTFGIGIIRNDGLQCYGTNTILEHIPIPDLGNKGRVIVDVTENTLIEGEYFLDVAVQRLDGFAYDYYREARKFNVYSIIKDVGVIRLNHFWNFE